MSQEHLFDGERCAYCNVNIYDEGADEPCIEHTPVVYTAETPKEKTA